MTAGWSTLPDSAVDLVPPVKPAGLAMVSASWAGKRLPNMLDKKGRLMSLRIINLGCGRRYAGMSLMWLRLRSADRHGSKVRVSQRQAWPTSSSGGPSSPTAPSTAMARAMIPSMGSVDTLR
jgi:hypothetical protein